MTHSQRYTGRVITTRPGERYGFIGLATLISSDGAPHDLNTSHDIFVHQDDCTFELRKDLEVSFEVVLDETRGGDALRATAVSEIVVGELVLVGAGSGAQTALTDPATLYVQPTRAQQVRMKPVDPETVRTVLANHPMARVPRGEFHHQDAATISREIIGRIFPQFVAISDEAGGDLADESFDEVIKTAVEDHKSLGMNAQAEQMLRQANVYKGLRTVLRSEDDLLTPQTIIPIQYLPDLFMAVPVWYFWGDGALARQASEAQASPDPQVHEKVRAICDLLPNERWMDTFLMFNRRMRTLADYEGDIIPPKIIARMRKMAPLFDHLVIMTPYHDVAGKDWEDFNWMRSIDPYVVGFLKGIPLMFVVGRFSDSGTFPLYSELLADTIHFLRQNVEKLKGFNKVDSPYWYHPGPAPQGGSYLGKTKHGNHLVAHTRELLAAFDRGELFDWLRGVNPQVPATT